MVSRQFAFVKPSDKLSFYPKTSQTTTNKDYNAAPRISLAHLKAKRPRIEIKDDLDVLYFETDAKTTT